MLARAVKSGRHCAKMRVNDRGFPLPQHGPEPPAIPLRERGGEVRERR